MSYYEKDKVWHGRDELHTMRISQAPFGKMLEEGVKQQGFCYRLAKRSPTVKSLPNEQLQEDSVGEGVLSAGNFIWY